METICLSDSSNYFTFVHEPCVMALGSFDGVHLGHLRVIRTAKDLAQRHNLPLAVLTFYPHPREVLGQGKVKVDYLMPMEHKESVMAAIGVDRLYVVKFDMDFASLSPRQFVERYLLHLNVKHAVIGFDFTYGAKGKGNTETLESDGGGLFRLHVVPRVEHEGQKISSTLIRELLRLGEVKRLSVYLGRFYMTRGQIYSFDNDPKQGTRVSLWVHHHYTLPTEGTYAINIIMNHRAYNGIAIVTLKPNGSRKLDLVWND
jgi:riboflavin kinase / FMN adenylyltransferase